MSFGRRLWNVARGELRGLFRGREARGPIEDDAPEPTEAPRVEAREERVEVEIRIWYANLELPYGASADEVRAAYRRLMRRYHPDRHHGDPEAERAANELAAALRRAYEGLLAHLG